MYVVPHGATVMTTLRVPEGGDASLKAMRGVVQRRTSVSEVVLGDSAIAAMSRDEHSVCMCVHGLSRKIRCR